MQVEWRRRASRDLERIRRGNPTEAQRIVASVLQLADDGQGDVRPVVGEADLYRLRVGDWRVLFTADRESDTLTVTGVRRRDQAYR